MSYQNLFFGFEVAAPWQEEYPKGKIIPEASRHATFIFLGPLDPLKISPSDVPKPPFSMASSILCDKILFLPDGRPHVVAYHFIPLTYEKEILKYREKLFMWLAKARFHLDDRPFLPHLTLARAPFHVKEWEEGFTPFPALLKNFHLYQSQGDLNYLPIWTFPLTSPFVEISHTGDLAFDILGESPEQIFLHAQIALAFQFPLFTQYISSDVRVETIEEIIMKLNEKVTILDEEIGSPFKAICFHGDLKKAKDGLLRWEMIVDI